MTDKSLLEVNDLVTQFETEDGIVQAVNNVSYTIKSGQVHGFVGESGAGKTVTGLSLIRLVESPGEIVSGEVNFKGENLLEMSNEELRRVRGDKISMIFQDPMTALNPSYTIGTQIIDTILEHTYLTKSEAREKAISLLDDVGIPAPETRIDNYPHQFSGGMRQRAIIAMALSCDPDLIIADEPTTALDVTIQAEILDLLLDLKDTHDVAIQLITHNMGVIAKMCDTVSVMYAGRIIEEGPIERIFQSPQHPYTVGLLNAIPRINDDREQLDSIPGTMPDLVNIPSGCAFRDRCEHATEECAEGDLQLETVPDESAHKTRCIRHQEINFADEKVTDSDSTTTPYPSSGRVQQDGDTLVKANNLKKYFVPESHSWLDRLFEGRKFVHAVDGVSLEIQEGETVGLVGESGCGKTTLGRTITKLYDPTEGTIVFSGMDISDKSKRALRSERDQFQMIFQDPFSSLNPRKKVGDIVEQPLKIHNIGNTKQERRDRVAELLEEVGLKESHMDRYPHEFSGGQKQRIGIARALAVEPDFIVADEPVSALDVSVQAKILNLFIDLQEQYNLTYLFVAHDLNVVQHISDRIAVMYLGEIVEMGPTEELFSPPYHPYTEILLSSISQPTIEDKGRRIEPEGQIPSPIDPPEGCRFHTRCPYAMPECSTTSPNLKETGDGTEVRCHLLDEEFMEEQDESMKNVLDSQLELYRDM